MSIFIILMFINYLYGSVVTTDPYTDALLSLKSEFVDTGNSLRNWLVKPGENSSGTIHSCSWSGVKCNYNRTIITALDLSINNLAGTLSGKQFKVFTGLLDLNLSYNSFSEQLPSGIFEIASLRSLDVSRNNFSGEFPDGVSGLRSLVVLDAFSNSFEGALPVGVAKIRSLKLLNLAGSYFSGPIPSAYGDFESLEYIHLAGNLLSGELPTELGRLETVTHMEIGYNSFRGNIPRQLGNISALEYLDIAGADLSGLIPKELANLTKLHTLFLFRNKLSGIIPWEIGRIRPLTNLDLSDNQLTGLIPESFSELKNLTLLSLMYNELNGTVPEGIAQLPSLETLLIWNNFFSGSLPEELGRYSRLKWLDVSTNNFVGRIPPGICSGGELHKLILFSNNFSGDLSPISNCSSLTRLRIEDNSFSGEISLRFREFSVLTYADLSRNRFAGGIPADIFQASKLEYFNVSYNPKLGGIIPLQTWSSLLLQNFSASSCNISGVLPLFIKCKSVSVIELRMNNLSGEIPATVSNCLAIEKIDLAENRLVGVIPEELASLPSLSSLDLSHNNLSGTIPVKFGESSSLVHLNVSFNDISGSIPSSNVLRSLDSSAYTGNSKLCGVPLRPCYASIAIFSSKGITKLTWIVLFCVGVVILIAASLVGIFYRQMRKKGEWKTISFNGLPEFAAKDILSQISASVCKAVLPNGITVWLKKITVKSRMMMTKRTTNRVTQMGCARNKNVVSLLGFCYREKEAYVLYDCFPNGNLAEKINTKRIWESKYNLVIGIARGLYFLHHECSPAIPHGDLKLSNVVFDEDMEPRLAEFGVKYLTDTIEFSFPAPDEIRNIYMREAYSMDSYIKEELYKDMYSFGEIILEILTSGKVRAGQGDMPKEVLLSEVYNDNIGSNSDGSLKEEIKSVLEVALLCTKSRPSAEEAVKMLLECKQNRK